MIFSQKNFGLVAYHNSAVTWSNDNWLDIPSNKETTPCVCVSLFIAGCYAAGAFIATSCSLLSLSFAIKNRRNPKVQQVVCSLGRVINVITANVGERVKAPHFSKNVIIKLMLSQCSPLKRMSWNQELLSNNKQINKCSQWRKEGKTEWMDENSPRG